jgi:hypothetical protein
MAGIFGGGGVSTPKFTCLQSQTSVQGLPIPIMWGANRISANVIDAFNFYSQPAGKGGKGGKGNNLDYYAAVILALCEGASQVDGWHPGHGTTIGQAWQDGQAINFASLGFGFYPGDDSQEPWSTAVAAGRGLSYAPTCYLANGNLALGTSATIPNYNYEIFSTFNGYNVGLSDEGVRLPDANFGNIIPDLLQNPRYTLDMPSQFIDLDSCADLVTYHLASNIFVSPVLKDQEQVQSIFQRWATIGNFWIFWNGVILKVVPLGDTPVTGNGVTYTPNVAPIYALGPDDFVVSDKNSNKAQAPVTVTRKDPADGYNLVQLNCSIRDNGYQNTPYRWSDQTSIDEVGVQAPNVISSTEICYETTANTCIALIGQRQLYIRNDYAFKLPPTFILLEPGDIVTLTEPNIGLSNFPVRIKTIDEDDKGNLSFVAEEFPIGVGTPGIVETEPWGGGEPWNVNVTPGSVNAPAFIQPDPSLTQNQSEVWAALSWDPATTGGCGVFLSFDGLNYSELGTTESNSLQGTLTAELPLASGLDTTNTLAVDCTESAGIIPTGATEEDAQTYRTLCLVDDELLAYGSVTPTGEYTADLTYLERGLYGTVPAAHSPGAPFSRIDSTLVFQYPLPPQYLGTTLHFKFPTANPFGNEPQSLAECVEYSFSPSAIPVPGSVAVSYLYSNSETLTGAQMTWTNNDNFDPTTYNFRWSQYPSGTEGQSYGTLTIATGTLESYTIPADDLLYEGDGYNYISMQAQAGEAQSNWSGDVGGTTVPFPTDVTATNIFDEDGSYAGLRFDWTPPDIVPSSYTVSWVGVGDGSNGYYSAPGGGSSVLVPAATVLAISSSPASVVFANMQAQYGTAFSEYTPLVEVTGAASYPALITSGVNGSPITGGVNLTWESQGPDVTSYEIYAWYPSTGTPTQLQTREVPAPASAYQFTGLSSGETYSVAVVTYNLAGTQEVFNGDGEPTLSEIITVTPS